MKRYVEIEQFERQTIYCPLYLVRRILDRQIDAMVYDLYALTPDEIKIVEASIR